MDRVYTYLKMELDIKEHLNNLRNRVLENIISQMEIFIKVLILMIKKMDMVDINIITNKFIWANGIMIKNMVMVNFYIIMGLNIEDNLKMALDMEMDKFYMKMDQNSKDFS